LTHKVIQNLLPDDSDHVKALLVSHAVYDHISMNPNELSAIEYRVLVLTGGVDDLGRKVLVLVANDFGEGVLNGGIVGVDKVTVHELYSERALAWRVKVSQGALVVLVGLCVKLLVNQIPRQRTNRSAADYGHLALSLLGRHVRDRFARKGLELCSSCIEAMLVLRMHQSRPVVTRVKCI